MPRPISRPRRKPGPKPDPDRRPTTVVTARVDRDLADPDELTRARWAERRLRRQQQARD